MEEITPIETSRLLITALCNQITRDTENAFFMADELLEHHMSTRKAFLKEFVGEENLTE